MLQGRGWAHSHVVNMRAAGTRLARRVHEARSDEQLEWLQFAIRWALNSRPAVVTTMSHERRCYSVQQLLDKLSMPRSTFLQLKNAGKLPFLEELRPSDGRSICYRAEPIDRYLAHGWAACRRHTRKTGFG